MRGTGMPSSAMQCMTCLLTKLAVLGKNNKDGLTKPYKTKP